MDDKGCMDFGAKAMPLLAMGAFIDRWTDGWMDGWMCRGVDCRWIEGRTDGRMAGRTDGCVEVWIVDPTQHDARYRRR